MPGFASDEVYRAPSGFVNLAWICQIDPSHSERKASIKSFEWQHHFSNSLTFKKLASSPK